ncbi:helix-turn-helix domain-containing protein [Rhodopila sp.]|uniref:helix-turn-helix domain-containing protein n=1 Tax=Rhodopila sp. TaxID=2480087 RepID=UPI003D0FE3B2
MFDVLAYTITDCIRISGLGRTTLYEAIGAGKIEARKAGGRTLIMADSLRAFIAGLPAADIRTGRAN